MCRQVPKYGESLLGRHQNDVPVRYMAVLAPLQIDRPGEFLMTVQSAARNAGNLLVIDDGRSVLRDSDGPADQRDIKALPFSRFARLFRTGSDESVHAASAVTRRLLS